MMVNARHAIIGARPSAAAIAIYGNAAVLWRPVQPNRGGRCRLILAHLERPLGGLGLVADAPARDKRTGERCIGK
jgi:hypothetical protein